MIADLFERSYSDFISELKDNEKLKTFMGVRKTQMVLLPPEGYYVGFKLIVAIGAENYELLGYQLYDGCSARMMQLYLFHSLKNEED